MVPSLTVELEFRLFKSLGDGNTQKNPRLSSLTESVLSMMLRPDFKRPSYLIANAEKRKELERKVAEMEEAMVAKKAESEKLKRELEEKVEELQRGLQEMQRKQAEMEKQVREDTSRALDEVRRKLEDAEKVRSEGLSHLQSKLEERHFLTLGLLEDVKATLAHFALALESSSS